MAERMTELMDEVKGFHKHSEEIIRICTELVKEMEEVEDFNSFLELYATVYRYLSHCTASFFEFNCKMETLLLGTDCSPPYLQRESSRKDIGLGLQKETTSNKKKSAEEQTKISTGTQPELNSNLELQEKVTLKEDSNYQADANSSIPLPDKKECDVNGSREVDNSVNVNTEPLLEEREQVEHNIRSLEFSRTVGAIHDVILVRLVSPIEFYVYILCEDLEKMENLEEELSKIDREGNEQVYNQSLLHHKSRKILASKILGSYALGFSQQLSTWTRIKILEWRIEKDDDLVQVFDIDHCTSCLLSLTEILPLSNIVKDYPVFTQKCYMPSIVPIAEDWSEEDKTIFEIFTETTELKSHMEIEIVEIDSDRDDGAIGVNLFLPKSRISINDKLVEFGIAEERDGSSRGTYLPLCAVGDKIPVKVTCISRVNHIFCVKDYCRMDENDELQYLIELLNDPRSVMAELENPPRVGDFVIARYEDGLWYRAQVVKSNKELNSWRVIFLDYGNTESVPVNDVRKIEEKHLKVPFQMIECLLEEVEPKRDIDQYSATTYLNERVAEDVVIEIRRILNGVRSFYSVNVFDKSGKDIIEDLISAGVADRSKKC